MTRGKRRTGVVTVEFALLAPVLFLFLFASIELGWLACDKALLFLSAGAAVRTAGLGFPTDQIVAEALSAGENLDPEALTVTMEYRTPEDDSGWSEWETLTDTTQGEETVNSAPQGAQVRVTLSYEHKLLFTSLFGMLADEPGGTIRTLHQSAVIRRE